MKYESEEMIKLLEMNKENLKSSSNSYKIGELLISKGADINAKDIIYQNIL